MMQEVALNEQVSCSLHHLLHLLALASTEIYTGILPKMRFIFCRICIDLLHVVVSKSAFKYACMCVLLQLCDHVIGNHHYTDCFYVRTPVVCNVSFECVLFLMQGHALMTRHSGSANPCPVIDFDAGFNAWMAYAFGLPKGVTVEQKFGKHFGTCFWLVSCLTLSEMYIRIA